MSWRKWLVRTLVFTILGVSAAAGFLYQRFTNPSAVRQQVLSKLGAHLPGASISLDSAHMKLLGNVALNELRMARRDDPTQTEFLYVPSMTIFHDKEQMLDGKWAIRKMVWDRPMLHISRDKEGKWNVGGILGSDHPDLAIPTILIRHGTIYWEDRMVAAGKPPMEIKDVNMTLINDPLPTLTFEGTGLSDVGGTVQISGRRDRKTGEAVISLQAPKVPIGPALFECLKTYAPDVAEEARELRGTGALQADMFYHPNSLRPWTHDLQWQIHEGRIHHPKLPMPLDHLEASIHCLDGQVTLERLTANAGRARVRLQGMAQAPKADTDLKGTLEVHHLEVTPNCFEHLPASLQKINQDFAPAGTLSMTIHFARKAGQWFKRCQVQPEDLSVSFVHFPYPLEHVSGTLNQEVDPARNIDKLTVDLNGLAGGRRVTIQGKIMGAGKTAGVDLTLMGKDLLLDEKLLAALPGKNQELARSFHPSGKADFEASIYRPCGDERFRNRFRIRFHGAAVRYAVFPYPLENVSGVLDIQPGHWEFRDFQGTHKGAEVRTSGRTVPTLDGDKIAIAISGSNVLLDPDLEGALQPELKKAWKTLQPAGRMDFQAQVECAPRGGAPEVAVTVLARDCSIQPTFFPYLLEHLNGTIQYEAKNVYVKNASACHGRTVMTLDRADVCIDPNCVWADLRNLRGNPLVPDDDLLRALPPALRNACLSLQLRDPMAMTTRLVVKTFADADKPPIIFWDGQLGIRDVHLRAGVALEHVTGTAACRGNYNGRQLQGLQGNLLFSEAVLFQQPFRDIQSQLVVDEKNPNVLQLPGLRAGVFGGQVYGPARIELGPTLRYELNLTASEIKLEEFGKLNLGPNAPVSGLLGARLNISGEGSEVSGLRGRGTIDVPNGRLYNLPPLLRLLKFLNLRMPDATAFEEAHATFSIQGPRLLINKLDLFGNSVSLRGKGEMDLYGSDVNLDLYAVWGRIVEILPPILKELPPLLSKQLFKIKMRGPVADPVFHKEPVPVLVEPVKELLDRVGGRK